MSDDKIEGGDGARLSRSVLSVDPPFGQDRKLLSGAPEEFPQRVNKKNRRRSHRSARQIQHTQPHHSASIKMSIPVPFADISKPANDVRIFRETVPTPD